MRPLLIWLAILTTTGTLNAIWTGDLIQTATFAAAVLAVGTLVLFQVLANPDALRRGAPGARGAETIVRASAAAALAAIGLSTLVVGVVFGHFLIDFGAAVLIVGLTRLVLERRAQHAAERAAAQRRAGAEASPRVAGRAGGAPTGEVP
ncbi:hypothetical protein [Conexibacter sp. DBS9H8]|uniref:hypothetical protein n=1 Tax=Conexibacter sp. DBS9H8 TaxID=2937801 RepID=UPI00200C7E11|nr:hypothetical protein [Conexibacter sp. DBS9H8]